MSCESCYCLCAPSWKCSRCLEKGWNDDTQSLNLLWLEIAVGVCWFCSENMEHGLKPRDHFFFSAWWFQTYSNIFIWSHVTLFSWINGFLEEHPNTGFSMFYPWIFPWNMEVSCKKSLQPNHWTSPKFISSQSSSSPLKWPETGRKYTPSSSDGTIHWRRWHPKMTDWKMIGWSKWNSHSFQARNTSYKMV